MFKVQFHCVLKVVPVHCRQHSRHLYYCHDHLVKLFETKWGWLSEADSIVKFVESPRKRSAFYCF